MFYSPRLLDSILDTFFAELPAVALEGAKGVGKTATATQRARQTVHLDNPRERASLAADPYDIANRSLPLLLDEWQLLPEVWDVVRRLVDEGAAGASFLLTGSATPSPEKKTHSGAGRITTFTMRPLAFAERAIVTPSVSLANLLAGKAEIGGDSEFTVRDYTEEMLRSGFPGIRNYSPEVREVQLDAYLDYALDRNVEIEGVNVHRRETLRAWLAAYGAASATQASYTAILNAATAAIPDKPARRSVEIYRDYLSRIFLLDPIPAWTPAFTPLGRLTLSPKHHLVDPALAARLARVGVDELMRGEGEVVGGAGEGTWLGNLFESFVAQSVRVYAQVARARVSHMRVQDGRHEVDLILEGRGGRVLAIEVKLSGAISDSDVKHLLWLKEKLGDKLIDALVVHTGPRAYRRPDGVGVVPFALLGP